MNYDAICHCRAGWICAAHRRDLLPAELRPLVEFCYVTGWRWHSEARPLAWAQVDFAHGAVSIDPGQTKGGEGRVFVTTTSLRKLLQKQRAYTDAVEAKTEKPCPLVFHRDGQPISHFYRRWRDACDTAKVPGRLLHDSRRTAIRNLVRAGVSEAVAMKMCGHQTRSVFDRYNITSERDLRDAATLLEAHHKGQARAHAKARTTKSLQSGRRRARPRNKAS